MHDDVNEHTFRQRRLVAGYHFLEWIVDRDNHAHGACFRIHGIAETDELGLPFGDVIAHVQLDHRIQRDQFGELLADAFYIDLHLTADEQAPQR